jgi:hypothetical protein
VHHAAAGEHRLWHDEEQDGVHRAANERTLIFENRITGPAITESAGLLT